MEKLVSASDSLQVAKAGAPPSARVLAMRLVWGALFVTAVSMLGLRVWAAGPFGHDFTMFLTGAHLIANGQAAQLYDLAAQAEVQRAIGGGAVHAGGVLPFNYPPFVGGLFLPLTVLSPEAAYAVWLVVQIAVLVAWVVWVMRWFPRWGFAAPLSLPYALLAFQPILETLLVGQMSLVLVVLWWWALVSWRNERWGQLGVAVALSAFKPQMAALLVVALVADRRWRSLAYFALTQATVWLLAVLIAGPQIVAGYIDILMTSATTTNTLGFTPAIMPNLRGLLTVLGVSPEATMLPSLLGWVTGLMLTAFIWRTARPVEVKFGATAVVAVLLSPHLYRHDVSLLAVAIVGASLAAGGTATAGRRLDALFVPCLLVFAAIHLMALQLYRSYTPLILAVWLLGLLLLWVIGRHQYRRGTDAKPAVVA